VPGKAEGGQRSKKRSGGDDPPNEESIKRTRTESTSRRYAPLAKEVMSPSDRKCAYQLCNNIAKFGSKYCSEPCSMSVAREVVKKQQEAEIATSAADAADMGALEDIARRKAEIDEKLHKLEKEQQELEKAIHSIAKRNGIKESFSPPTSPKGVVASPSQGIDSPPFQSVSPLISPLSPSILPQGASLPLESEYPESHKGGHANKRKKSGKLQRNNICGCPTTDSPSGFCELLRKNCVKHINWEEMKRATLEHEKTQHKKALTTLASDEMRVRNRMARRKECANDAHRTIIEA